MNRLDITSLSKEHFSIERCNRAYDRYVENNGLIPDFIYVKIWQLLRLTDGKTARNKAKWRGIPLKIK